MRWYVPGRDTTAHDSGRVRCPAAARLPASRSWQFTAGRAHFRRSVGQRPMPTFIRPKADAVANLGERDDTRARQSTCAVLQPIGDEALEMVTSGHASRKLRRRVRLSPGDRPSRDCSSTDVRCLVGSLGASERVRASTPDARGGSPWASRKGRGCAARTRHAIYRTSPRAQGHRRWCRTSSPYHRRRQALHDVATFGRPLIGR